MRTRLRFGGNGVGTACRFLGNALGHAAVKRGRAINQVDALLQGLVEGAFADLAGEALQDLLDVGGGAGRHVEPWAGTVGVYAAHVVVVVGAPGEPGVRIAGTDAQILSTGGYLVERQRRGVPAELKLYPAMAAAEAGRQRDAIVRSRDTDALRHRRHVDSKRHHGRAGLPQAPTRANFCCVAACFQTAHVAALYACWHLGTLYSKAIAFDDYIVVECSVYRIPHQTPLNHLTNILENVLQARR